MKKILFLPAALSIMMFAASAHAETAVPTNSVVTVGIDNGTNAAQILSLKYDYLKDELKAAKQKWLNELPKRTQK